MDSKFSVAWVAELHEFPATVTHSLLCLTVGLLAVLIAWYKWNRRRMEKMIGKIPGPSTWPIVGNAHMFLGLDMQGICEKMLDLMDEYGRTIRFWLGPYLWVNLAEPHHLEAMLTSEIATNKDPTYQFFKDQSDGIFIASGEKWKRLRKLANPAFNQKLLEHFMECFNEQSKIFVKVLEERVDGPRFDIHKYTARCTLDIVCGTQMGVTSREQIDNTSDFATNLLNSTVIAKQRFYKIHLQSNLIYYRTNLAKENAKHIAPLHKFVRNVIEQRLSIKKKEESISDDILDAVNKKRKIYLDAILEHYKHLSIDEMVLTITDMFIAGSDTTAVATAYAIMLMGTFPDVQEKVYKEVTDIVGTGDDDITHADVTRMAYVEMVLKEVLRHYTIPAIVRKLDKDQFIGDLTLPAGTSVQLCIFGVHRDPRYWSHPDEFYPDHFLPENVAKRPKFSYIPFSMGPRNCPGHAFAMMSMKVMIATFVRKYKVKANFDMKNMRYNNIFMLEPANGYPVEISAR